MVQGMGMQPCTMVLQTRTNKAGEHQKHTPGDNNNTSDKTYLAENAGCLCCAVCRCVLGCVCCRVCCLGCGVCRTHRLTCLRSRLCPPCSILCPLRRFLRRCHPR